MSTRPAGRVAAALGVLVLLVLPWSSASGSPPRAVTGQEVTVELGETAVTAGPGDKITFESVVRNGGGTALEGYVAQLEILTTDESVYVDPEDWSAERTQHLDSVAPGESVTLDWSVRAVTSGPLILFVSVTSPDSETVTSSAPLNLTVEGQRVVNAGGVMPLVTWMPAGVLALLVVTFVRRRRHR